MMEKEGHQHRNFLSNTELATVLQQVITVKERGATHSMVTDAGLTATAEVNDSNYLSTMLDGERERAKQQNKGE